MKQWIRDKRKQNKLHGNKQKYIKFRARCDNRWTVILRISEVPRYIQKNAISEAIKSRIAAASRCYKFGTDIYV
jgi:macrodomain Ter protein organizer (MatP/YcbG family)